MPDAEVVITWEAYAKNFLAISLFFALTLGSGQMAYLFATVPFIQMMKPMNCIFASLAAFMIGLEVPTFTHMVCVVTIAFGVFIATYSAVQFSMAACLLQMTSSVTEGARLAFLQRATTSAMKVDPVSTVYYYSFPCAVCLGIACFSLEKHLDFSKLLSPWVLVINCTMAVLLNVLIANVIKKTSAVIFTLFGIVKDIGIIGASSFLFSTHITKLMVCGYSISLSGICMYKAYKDNLELFKKHGFLNAATILIGKSMEVRKSVK